MPYAVSRKKVTHNSLSYKPYRSRTAAASLTYSRRIASVPYGCRIAPVRPPQSIAPVQRRRGSLGGNLGSKVPPCWHLQKTNCIFYGVPSRPRTYGDSHSYRSPVFTFFVSGFGPLGITCGDPTQSTSEFSVPKKLANMYSHNFVQDSAQSSDGQHTQG